MSKENEGKEILVNLFTNPVALRGGFGYLGIYLSGRRGHKD
jgi:hypothetical protein